MMPGQPAAPKEIFEVKSSRDPVPEESSAGGRRVGNR
jgi:hypothetical protein